MSVGLIGCTGAVGQRFIQQLSDHPWFQLEMITASSTSVGKKYGDAVTWMLDDEMPDYIKEIKIQEFNPAKFKHEGIDLIFSALPATVAKTVEKEIVRAGSNVFSNASSNRMKDDVPLLIADINPKHLSLVNIQKKKNPKHGIIVTNPNCSAVGLATALKPLEMNFGLRSVVVSTYQALSGAGYPGVPSIEITGNVIPYIPNEEEKIENECKKILGSVNDETICSLKFDIVVNCTRVPVRDGHLQAVYVKLKHEINIDEVRNALINFNGANAKDAFLTEPLPTAPDNTLVLLEPENRPQPLKDLYHGTPNRARGMAVAIGRIKVLNKNELKFYLLVHNTIRGAAGCSIMNAELARVGSYF